MDINPIALFCFEPNFTAIVTVTKDCKGGLAGEDGVRIGFMSPLIYCLSKSTLSGPISSLYEKNNPRNIKYMPVVIFLVCLGVFAYLISNKNPSKSTDSFYCLNVEIRLAKNVLPAIHLRVEPNANTIIVVSIFCN